MGTDISFGKVITVISEKPIEFYVQKKRLEATSFDLHRQWPLIFVFRKSRFPSANSQLPDFTIKVEDQFISSNFHNDEDNHELNNGAIRFGLFSKKKSPGDSQFLLSKVNWNILKSEQLLSGPQLKSAILSFCYFVNEEWPDQGISVFDLLDNFDNSKEELEAWVRTLDEAELLVRKQGFNSYRENRGHVNAQSWKINLKNLSQIEVIIKTKSHNQLKSDNLKVFLSYSSLDKILAGKIKTELVKYGVNVFLAHEDIEPSEEWISIIQENLDTCPVFVILLTQNSKISHWVNQESGQAYNKGSLIIPVKSDCDPFGFLGKFQAVTLREDAIENAISKIVFKIEQKFRITLLRAS